MLYLRNVFLIFVLFLLFSSSSSWSATDNPFKNIQYTVLENGLTVVLSPSSKAKNVAINIRVDGGRLAETKKNIGVTHLLEHVVFTEAQLGTDQTYLQVITEAGGRVNAAVYDRETIFYATIGHEKSDWILEQFYKMIFHRNFDDKLIQLAKGSVMMEIGQPSWLAGLLRYDLIGPFKQRYFPWRDFSNSEFNIYFPNFSDDETRLSTLNLKKVQIEKYYQDYYKPDNMVLMFAGNFDPQKILRLIKKTFGTIQAEPFSKKLKLNIRPRPYPYNNEFLTAGTPLIYVGTKIWKPQAVDEIVTEAYMEYLAHRMMKELRNKKGETYTVSHNFGVNDEAGASYLRFESPVTEVDKNYLYVEKIIQDEARLGKISDSEIRKAIDFYKKHEFGTSDTDALSMIKFAYYYHRHIKKYGSSIPNIYEIVHSLTPEEFRTALKRTFLPERAYKWIYRPPLYSKIDMNILWVMMIILTAALYQALLKRPSPEVRIHWTAQVWHSPGLALEFLIVMGVTYMLCFLIDRPVTWCLDHFQFYKSSILINGYFIEALRTFIFMSVFTLQFAALPRRLMIDDYGLTIKHIAFYAWSVPSDQIISTRISTPLRILSNPKYWLNPHFRWAYFNWAFWKPGLILEIKKGPIYFLGFDQAAKIKEDLSIYLISPKSFTSKNQDAA